MTHYRVLKRYGYVTLIECRLETGRTHQIRVHMQWKGHPLFGDERYGGDRILKGTTFNKYKQFIENCFAAMPRQALHAKSLGFQHPLRANRSISKANCRKISVPCWLSGTPMPLRGLRKNKNRD